MRPIATDTHDFPSIRDRGCIYVDKVFRQFREKGYAEPFRADTRPVWLVGLSFDSKTRHLGDCAAERYSQKPKGEKR